MKQLFKNALAYIEGAFQQKDIFVIDGRIADFKAPCCSFDSVKVYDCKGKYLVPGFIDIHTHGGAGVDVNIAKEEDFATLSRFFASKGVTAYLASVLTDSVENTHRVLDTVSRYRLNPGGGATLLGVHLEGPFLSPAKKGAMPSEYLKNADFALFESYFNSGCVRYITIAPEIPGGLELIHRVSEYIPVAIGHSQADYKTAVAAINNGALSATHTFNAMRGIDRTEPGILGAVLEAEIFTEIIADGKHVHPANLRLLHAVHSKDKIISVTDSMQAAGMPNGEYTLGKNTVTVCDGEAFIKGSSVRAGSVLTADEGFRGLQRFLLETPEKVLPFFTENPAALLKLNKGFIRIGYDADFALFNPDWSVETAFIAGEEQ